MADINRLRLRGQLIENYEGLVRKLTRRLGSSDYAQEALHETFLRLERVSEAEPVRSPTDYIFRTAINIAKDRQKAQNYRVSSSDVDAILNVCDDGPDPAQIVESRSEIEAFKRALAALPPRPREVLHSISIDGQSAREVAVRLRVSVRTVENDLKLALGHCADSLKNPPRRSGKPARS